MMGLLVLVGCESSGSPPVGEDAPVVISDTAPDAGPDAHWCTLVGCGPVVTLPVVYAGPRADLVAARITVCRNDGCAEGTFGAVPSEEGIGYGTTLSGDLGFAAATVWREAQQFRIDAEIHEDTHTLMAGDVYSVAVHASDERLLVEHQWTAVSYTEERPNGPYCEPVCHYAVVE